LSLSAGWLFTTDSPDGNHGRLLFTGCGHVGDVSSVDSINPAATFDRVVAHFSITSDTQESNQQRVTDGSIVLNHHEQSILEERLLIGDIGLNAALTRPLREHRRDTAVLFLSTSGPGDCFSAASRDFAAVGIASLRIDFAGFRPLGLLPTGVGIVSCAPPDG
jgi:hypothetical protein